MDRDYNAPDIVGFLTLERLGDDRFRAKTKAWKAQGA